MTCWLAFWFLFTTSASILVCENRSRTLNDEIQYSIVKNIFQLILKWEVDMNEPAKLCWFASCLLGVLLCLCKQLQFHHSQEDDDWYWNNFHLNPQGPRINRFTRITKITRIVKFTRINRCWTTMGSSVWLLVRFWGNVWMILSMQVIVLFLWPSSI